MKRKLTEKETRFLVELRDLMAKYSVMLSVEDERVCMEVEYSSDDELEPILLPEAVTVFYDLDELILKNS